MCSNSIGITYIILNAIEDSASVISDENQLSIEIFLLTFCNTWAIASIWPLSFYLKHRQNNKEDDMISELLFTKQTGRQTHAIVNNTSPVITQTFVRTA